MDYGTTRADGRGRDRPEEVWHGSAPARLQQLHAGLLDAGHSAAFANGLVGWIVAGDPEFASNATVASYRKALREYGPPTGNGHAPRARKRRGRKLAAVVAMAVGAGGLVSAAQSPSEGRASASTIGSADKTRSGLGRRRRRRGETSEPDSLAA